MKPDRQRPIDFENLTPAQHVRLEVLKLTYIHARDVPTLTDRADKLVDYVLTGAKGEKPQ